jgi:hypothetical protein
MTKWVDFCHKLKSFDCMGYATLTHPTLMHSFSCVVPLQPGCYLFAKPLSVAGVKRSPKPLIDTWRSIDPRACCRENQSP